MKISKCLTALALFVGSTAVTAQAEMVSIEPTTNNALFWIDQSTANNNSPQTYQTWGQVLTAPSGQNLLQTMSIYAESGGGSSAATNFGIEAFAWSPSLNRPVGPALYQSPLVSFSTPNLNPPDPTYGVSPTIFQLDMPVTGGAQYIFELVGNGTAGILTANSTSAAQIYLYQSTTSYQPGSASSFQPFGNTAYRSDITFSAVPLPASAWLTLSGMVGFGFMIRKRRLVSPVAEIAAIPCRR